MPLARYFLFVGGALLALLFISNAYLPKLPVADSSVAAVDIPVIRIHSDRKWPERVVFDTSIPTITPRLAANTVASVAAPATVADVSAKVRVREAFAQLQPPSDPTQVHPSDTKKPEPKPQHKRRIAKSRPSPPTMLVAQQPRFGFFGNNMWNSTW
jgi:hypothetical protein